MPYRQVHVAGAPAVALRTAALEVIVVPADGGRIAHLRRPGGREWLRPGRGWVERLTVGAAADGAGAAERLHAAPMQHDLREHAAGVSLASDAPVPGTPLVFRRELTLLHAAPVVLLRYGLAHGGGAPCAWLWHPAISWTTQPGSTVHVPGLTQVRVAAVQGRDDLEAGDYVAWPGAIGGDAARLTLPAALPWSVACDGDLGTAGRCSVTDPRRGEWMALQVDPAHVPHVGVALAAGHGDDAPPALHLAPRIGLPDDLVTALALGTAPVIAEGEERTWAVEVRLEEPN